MHVILATRGINKEVEEWKVFMQAQMWWWKRQPLLKDSEGNYIPYGEDEDGTPKYKRGPEELTKVAGALRPIQLWEYIIPEEGVGIFAGKQIQTSNLKELLAAMNLHHKDILRSEMKPLAWMVRKALHLKPVPEFPELFGKTTKELTQRFIPNKNGVAVYPLGMKADKKQDYIFTLADGTKQGWYQEGL